VLAILGARARPAFGTEAAVDQAGGATPSTPSTPPASAPSASPSLVGSVGSEIAEYADTDHVFVFTPSIAGSVSNPTAGWSFNGAYLVDVVSAASVDIVSTASRRWEEVRQEGSLSGAYHPGSFGVGANAVVSSEPDYLSLNAGVSVTQDLLNKNFTWLVGYQYGHDVAGRTGTPFSVFSHEIDRHAFKGGATVILDHATLASFVGDVVVESGDQSKPYRYIPLFAPGQHVPVGASVAQVASLRVSERPLEQLPLSRQRFAVSERLAHRFRASTLRLDERLYADSWGLKATTTDARYLLDFGRLELGPHVRAHAQSPVDFWQRAYAIGPGFSYPALRTGDRELGPLLTLTGGGSFQAALGPRATPRAWVIGVDVNGMWTRYLDDLYLTQRVSFVGGVSLEAAL
jgi:hypothetical protein